MLIAIGLHAWRVWTLNWLVAGLMVALSVVTPFWVIAPAYRPPGGAYGATDHSPQRRRGGTLLHPRRGRRTGRAAAGRRGDRARRLARSDPTGSDYSVFVHLVDEDGLIIAQHDTMPGGGLYPTSQWTPGETRMEEYSVRLPATAYTPNRAHWLVGLYDASSGERLPARTRRDVRRGRA